VSFVMADIPGIIEGAAEGAGLGHDFLRHIDRCRLIIHVVDVSGSEGRDPIEDFEAINAELEQYSADLAERPQIVVANKIDIAEDEEMVQRFRDYIKEQGLELFEISAAAHMGVKDLVKHAAWKLAELPPVTVYEPDIVEIVEEPCKPEDIIVTQYDDVWVLEGEWLERLVRNVNFSDYESRMYFDRMLRGSGIFERLEQMGINEGDTVSIFDLEFEYQS